MQIKPSFLLLFLFFLVACSTKKDTFLSRNYHALTTRDNVLFNGRQAFDKGVLTIKTYQKDNFWNCLPVEKMELKEGNTEDENSKNPDFEVAEAKAIKAVQKHSMNIGGREKNYQIDEAYLLLGKARYYDQRFFPALEAFNYILYKYPTSSTINTAKIWREKINMRLGNEEQAQKNISKLLEQKKLKKQVIADANALLAESFLNLEQKDSAIAKLKIAEKNTKGNAEKVRYRFILGQLYQELGIKDTALIYFQKVIDMNRKIDRVFLMQSYARKAQLFDFEKDNKEEFILKFNKLIADRENRPYKDILFFEMGVFYDKNNDQKLAKEFYSKSIKSNSSDKYLIASNYRNLGAMYFKNTDYLMAAKYYDSTLVNLAEKTREHIHIKKVRKDLDEVIQFESVAKINDSILNVVAMSDENRILYYEKYIDQLKKADEEKRVLEEKRKKAAALREKNSEADNPYSSDDDPNSGGSQGGKMQPTKTLAPPPVKGIASNNSENVFYFYNPSTVAFGKIEFKKKFGKRALEGNWKIPTLQPNEEVDTALEKSTDSEVQKTENQVTETIPPEYTTAFYIEKLPKTQVEIDSIAKERNFVYYQLGVIYKEKFKEYPLASTKLEKVLEQNPEAKLVLPSLYNLYKIYQIIDVAKAEEIKKRISSQYPDSRYAQIINNQNPNTVTDSETVELEYNKWYQLYQEEQFSLVLEEIECLITQYYGDEIAPKYELLKAHCIGKLSGLEAYKKAMQFVADNYTSTEEGKNAKEILTTEIPLLEKMNFVTTESKNWKILYKVEKDDEKTIKNITEKFNQFIALENYAKLILTVDNYTEKENFVVIQGIKSEAYAKSVALVLKEHKDFQITEPEVVISSEYYKIVQIKKNLSEYLEFRNPAVAKKQEATAKDIPAKDIPAKDIPEQNNPTQETQEQNIPDKFIPEQDILEQVTPEPSGGNADLKSIPVIKETPQATIPSNVDENLNKIKTPKK